jgi:hypothetical protein
MLKSILVGLAIAPMFAGAAQAQSRQPRLGEETVIDFAANGGITDWERDRSDRNAVFVRDRRNRWYRVTLSGPCLADFPSNNTMGYRTDPTGRFDRFSTVWSLRFPQQRCAVSSVKTSLAPPSRKSRKPHR